MTTSNVNQKTFGKLFSLQLDGYVYAQPLYAAGINVPGKGIHNLVFVAAEHDSVYAFDADAGTLIWHRSFINPPAATTVPAADTGETGDLIPEFGVTGTPVIDPSTKTLYVVANTKERGTYSYRLRALDLATGNEKTGSPVLINATGFVPLYHMQRPAMSYNAKTLAQTHVYNTTPTGSCGSVWQRVQGLRPIAQETSMWKRATATLMRTQAEALSNWARA